MKKDIAVLLHNVRSAHNVGSIFRTCDASGVSRIYLSGYTPTPTDRFDRARKDIAKTALGAEKFVPWEYHKSPAALIKKLSAGGGPSSGGKKEGWSIIGVEQSPLAIDYRKFSAGGGSSSGGKKKRKIVFIFGNEVDGIPQNILKMCDAVVEIPMHGKKESLNVSVAAGVILFSVR
ncbi:RNA methyltransferase [Candidatus Kaiserbacteria bacterium]|nr:RNA methyltransferase [Candidatus Kaiserbacteria bacterium]